LGEKISLFLSFFLSLSLSANHIPTCIVRRGIKIGGYFFVTPSGYIYIRQVWEKVRDGDKRCHSLCAGAKTKKQSEAKEVEEHVPSPRRCVPRSMLERTTQLLDLYR
jgi:hypothetical protein